MSPRFTLRQFLCSVVLVSMVMVLGGCAGKTPPMGPSPDDIYNQVHRQGERDTIAVLKEGMINRGIYGSQDPYIPLRTPELIVPIWVPARTDPRTDRRIDGHWEHTVLKESQWVNDD